METILAARILHETRELDLSGSEAWFPKNPLGEDKGSEPMPEELRRLYVVMEKKSHAIVAFQKAWDAFDSELDSPERQTAGRALVSAVAVHICAMNQFGDSLRFLHKKRPTDAYRIRAGWRVVWNSTF